MAQQFATRIFELVGRLSPKAFLVVDALCDFLEKSDGTGLNPGIVALRVACDVRKATTRRRRRA